SSAGRSSGSAGGWSAGMGRTVLAGALARPCDTTVAAAGWALDSASVGPKAGAEATCEPAVTVAFPGACTVVVAVVPPGAMIVMGLPAAVAGVEAVAAAAGEAVTSAACEVVSVAVLDGLMEVRVDVVVPDWTKALITPATR